MIVEISTVGVFFAGALSFLSPCVLPLVPPYLCYMAGIGIDDFRSEKHKGRVFIRWALLSSVIAFVMGFTTVFVALGASASTIGKLIAYYRDWFALSAGIIIIIFGLNFLGLFKIAFLFREARFQIHKRPSGPLGAYVIGLAFAFGWTPCIGPILGPVITLAGTKETVGEGAVLLGVYALGLGVPFLIAALFSSSFMRFLGAFRIHLGKVEKIIGIFLVVTGILFLTGSMQDFSFWLLEHYPLLNQIEAIHWHDIVNFLGFSR
ncbi:cytochrome C biogenesis protein [Bartonella henselae]|uniref:Cytochrome c-type biogenesis protein, transmembrane region n=2 Tax=Bartonella TaxID=773 RepID=X5M7V1_BARHN|nr:cytochrome c biogenesis CcdA family protein [Bartonella henselae]MDM9997030.1 cytochrome c biogenesis CcdA family protein [Bartonella henselae]OLL48662.1 cytochrome C biogenesis protein [Bartonella henselae]OLL51475.1 cytochrome C biogenesis protein [Bartonella henselae]OLL51920.1 cytochrome C biogenesis protein [Bartonella henselae]OLL54436.1 cytochrome C biogenesis protein [Bartonella henselae]